MLCEGMSHLYMGVYSTTIFSLFTITEYSILIMVLTFQRSLLSICVNNKSLWKQKKGFGKPLFKVGPILVLFLFCLFWGVDLCCFWILLVQLSSVSWHPEIQQYYLLSIILTSARMPQISAFFINKMIFFFYYDSEIFWV